MTTSAPRRVGWTAAAIAIVVGAALVAGRARGSVSILPVRRRAAGPRRRARRRGGTGVARAALRRTERVSPGNDELARGEATGEGGGRRRRNRTGGDRT